MPSNHKGSILGLEKNSVILIPHTTLLVRPALVIISHLVFLPWPGGSEAQDRKVDLVLWVTRTLQGLGVAACSLLLVLWGLEGTASLAADPAGMHACVPVSKVEIPQEPRLEEAIRLSRAASFPGL